MRFFLAWLASLGAAVSLGCATSSPPAAGAGGGALPEAVGLPFGFGATVAQVQAALGTQQAPESYRWQNPVTGKTEELGTQLRHVPSGVWLFWSPAGVLTTIRLDAPFAGSIGGVRIGDTRATVVARRGAFPPAPPALDASAEVRRVLDNLQRTRPRYVIGGEYGAGYDFGDGDAVRTIFLTPQRPGSATASTAPAAALAPALVAATSPPQAQPARPAGPVTKELLLGEWVSEQPLRLGTLALKGILFASKEAVAYDRLSIDRLRLFPTSFEYAADGTSLRMTVTFSAAGLQPGTKLTIPARFDASGQLVLGLGNLGSVYRIAAGTGNAGASAPVLWGTAMLSDLNMSAPLPVQAEEFKRRAELVAALAGAAGSVGFRVDLCGETFPELQSDARAGYRAWQERNRAVINALEAHLIAFDKAWDAAPGRKPNGPPLGESIRATVHAPQPLVRERLLQDRSTFAAFCLRFPAELRTTRHDLEVTQAAQVRTLREGLR